jgi:hypothetical protein
MKVHAICNLLKICTFSSKKCRANQAITLIQLAKSSIMRVGKTKAVYMEPKQITDDLLQNKSDSDPIESGVEDGEDVVMHIDLGFPDY